MRLRAWLGLAIGVTTSAWVHAGEPDARAEFEKGVGAMVQGHYPEACPLIAEANRREPQRPGVVFTLAECTRHLAPGERTAAVAYYQQYAALYAGMADDEKKQQAPRMATAERELNELKAQLAAIVVVIDGPAKGAKPTCDGAAMTIEAPQWVEPGDHTLHVTFDDAAPYDARITVSAGEMRKLTVKPLPANPADAAQGGRGPSGLLVGAIASGGIGVLGIVVGSVEGLVAVGQKSSINCPMPAACASQQSADTGNAARVNAWVSTVGFAVGIVGLGVGAVLLYFELRSHRHVAVRQQGMGLSLEGTW